MAARRLPAGVLAAAGFASMVAIIAVASLSGPDMGRRIPSVEPAWIHLPGFCGGQLIKLEEAAAKAPFEMLVPKHPLASPELLPTLSSGARNRTFSS